MIKLFLLLSIISIQGEPTTYYQGIVYKSLERCEENLARHETVLMEQGLRKEGLIISIESHCIEFKGFPPTVPS